MKRFGLALMTIMVLILTSSLVWADSFTFGPKVGVIMSRFTGEDSDFIRSRFDLSCGVLWDYPLIKNVGLQAELLYVAQGCDLYTIESYVDADGKTRNREIDIASYKLPYLQVPLMAKFVLPLGKKFKPYLAAGAYFSVNLGAKMIYLSGINEGEKRNLDKYTKDYDAGVLGGIGLDYWSDGGYVTFDIRYTQGMVASYDLIIDDQETYSKNAGISCMVGIAF
ncbi:MAG: PorT family protein [Candidatus Krumholzibacteriota bacterium]|nr:PorT family protein [Candidatus Krumholzibacteriota bacterium]